MQLEPQVRGLFLDYLARVAGSYTTVKCITVVTAALRKGLALDIIERTKCKALILRRRHWWQVNSDKTISVDEKSR